MALAGRGLALAGRGLALAGRSLALLDFSELGGDGVMACLAENGLWEDVLTERGWLLLKLKKTHTRTVIHSKDFQAEGDYKFEVIEYN